jgi:hypothetical protein
VQRKPVDTGTAGSRECGGSPSSPKPEPTRRSCDDDIQYRQGIGTDTAHATGLVSLLGYSWWRWQRAASRRYARHNRPDYSNNPTLLQEGARLVIANTVLRHNLTGITTPARSALCIVRNLTSAAYDRGCLRQRLTGTACVYAPERQSADHATGVCGTRVAADPLCNSMVDVI